MKVIDIDISRNIAGGFTLSVCGISGGERVSGGKVSASTAPLKVFTVNAEELIQIIRSYAYMPQEDAE